jgi:hypothetical protein
MSKSKKPITPSKWCYQPGKTVSMSPYGNKNALKGLRNSHGTIDKLLLIANTFLKR